MVKLDTAKKYLRVDHTDDDELIQSLIYAANKLCREVARIDQETLANESSITDVAMLYTIAYLYEHREEADHHELVMTLRSLLFSLREVLF